ncbi:MAG: hypothetical protein ACOC8B_08240 [Gemmatimonadota bacterium]
MKRWLVAIGWVLLCTAPASAQERPELLSRFGGLDAQTLFGVKAVAERSDRLAVLTEPAPAVHIFAGDDYAAFGREGEGPAELGSPAGLAWPDSSLVVLDARHSKLVSFASDGTFLGARTVRAPHVLRLHVVGSDTVLGTAVPMTRARAVIRLRGERQDTLLAYEQQGERIRLEASGAPSYTIYPPFSAQTVWTVLADGTFAVWHPGGAEIELRTMEGAAVGPIPYVGSSWPVPDADREAWFDETFTRAEFMGRRIFRPLLPVARERVGFPDEFSPVMALEPDPSGGVWIQKTGPAEGEVWVLVGRDGGERGTIRLPSGRELLHVGERGIAALARDELEVERVELYDRPEWAR